MSATVAYQGRGAKLQTSADDITYTGVAQLRTFAFSGLKSKEDDITNCDSPDAFMEVLMTIIDPGDVSYDGILDPENATTISLQTLLQAQTKTYFQILLPNGRKVKWQGYVQEHVPVKVDYSKALTFSGKSRITGPVTQVAP